MKNFFLESGGLRLDTDYYQGSMNTGILLLHGLCAIKERPKYKRIAEFLAEKGYSVLVINFPGSGKSDDAPVTGVAQAIHVKTAMAWLREHCQELVVFGDSYGAFSALLAFDQHVKALILMAPLTDKLKSKYLKLYEDQIDAKGTLRFEKDGRIHTLPQKFFVERESISQDDLVRSVRCPTLLVHGTNDETIPPNMSERAHEKIATSTLIRVEGGSHKLDESIEYVLEQVKFWLEKVA